MFYGQLHSRLRERGPPPPLPPPVPQMWCVLPTVLEPGSREESSRCPEAQASRPPTSWLSDGECRGGEPRGCGLRGVIPILSPLLMAPFSTCLADVPRFNLQNNPMGKVFAPVRDWRNRPTPVLMPQNRSAPPLLSTPLPGRRANRSSSLRPHFLICKKAALAPTFPSLEKA